VTVTGGPPPSTGLCGFPSDTDQREWPLANLLGARGVKRPLVQLLQADFQRLAEIARNTFGAADS